MTDILSSGADMVHDVQSSLLDRASAWATTLWDQAATRWTGRTGQDLSYRLHAVHPVLLSTISEECGPDLFHVLDLGCGDGMLLDDDRFGPFDSEHRYLGIDTCQQLLDTARNRHPQPGCGFMRLDVTDTMFSDVITGTGIDWNCILSVFVIQEIAGIDGFFSNLAQVMSDASVAILITVHPAFAEWLRETGALTVNRELTRHDAETGLWRWAGGYPIVDEPLEPFPLPHFQRTFDDYRRLLGDAGLCLDRIIEFPDTADLLPRLKANGISPFRAFPTNVYWPRIGEMPSAAALVVRKGTAS